MCDPTLTSLARWLLNFSRCFAGIYLFIWWVVDWKGGSL